MHSNLAAFEGVVRLVDWAEMTGRRRERMIREEHDSKVILNELIFKLA